LASRIQLCGKVVLEIDGLRLEGRLPGKQGLLVFAYLAANRRRVVGRGELAEVLWPFQAPADPDAAVTVVLSKLRAALGAKAIEGRSELRLALPDTWVDLEAAHEAIHRAEAAVARNDWSGAWGPARVALHIAQRGLLPGFDGPWIVERRRTLEELQLRALRCVGESGLGLGGAEFPAAERAARSLVALAPLRETGHLLLMHSLLAQGDASEALLVYEDLRRLLRQELGTSPAGEVQDLYQLLLQRTAPVDPRPIADNLPEMSV
jgi:DNA-binding SARP family transcriptional activator